MLVDKNKFRKIKVGFLMVGHTHDHVDQMFNRFSTALRSKNAFTLTQLTKVIKSLYTPTPEITLLEEMYNFKQFMEELLRAIRPLHNITFN